MNVTLAIGTMKGAWFARSGDRVRWDLDGPYLKGWQVSAFGRAPDDTYLLATASSWYGAALHRSKDLSDWHQIVSGPSYAEADGRKLTQIWTIRTVGSDMYAGVAEAGLFHSADAGENWSGVAGLDAHPSRDAWSPGAGGLCCHGFLSDPHDPARMWVAISAVGVFATEDGGKTWELRNDGVTVTGPDDAHDIGYCVHCLVADPDDADIIWRQDHKGVYRTSDGGRSWERIENGLPAGFGFPIDRDPNTGRLFVAPMESDEFRMPVEGHLGVFHSTDRGDTWQPGQWVDAPSLSFQGVLRGAMAVDGHDPCGVYAGTMAGQVIASLDVGETWTTLPWTFPRINSVEVFVD